MLSDNTTPDNTAAPGFANSSTPGPSGSQDQVLSLVSELEDRLAKLKDYQQESTNKAEEIEARESALSDRDTQLQAQAQELQSLTDALNSRESAAEEARLANEARANELANQATINDQAQQELASQKQQVESDLQSLAEESGRIQAERQQLEQTQAQLAQEQQAQGQALAQLNNDQAQYQTDRQALQAAQAGFEAQQTQIQSQTQTLATEQESLNQRQASLEEQQLNQAELQSELDNKAKQLEQGWDQFRQETSSLETKFDELRKQQSKIDGAKQSIEDERGQIAGERQVVEELKAELETKEQTLHQELEQKTQTLEDELQAQRESLKEELRQQRENHDNQLQQERNALETDRMDLSMREQAIQSERVSIDGMRRQVAEQAAQARNGGLEADEAIQEQLRDLETRQAELNSQTEQLQVQRDELAQAREAAGQDQSAIQSLQQKLSETEQALQAAQKTLARAQEESKDQENLGNTLRIELEQVELLTKQFNDANQELEQANDTLTMRDEALADKQEKIESLEQTLASERTAHEAFKAELENNGSGNTGSAELAEREQSLNEREQALEAKQAEIKTKLDESRAALREEKERLEQQAESLGSSDTGIDAQAYAELQRKAEKYDRRKAELQEAEETLRKRREKLKEQKRLQDQKTLQIKEADRVGGSAVHTQKMQGIERERQMLIEVKKFLERSETEMVSRWATHKASSTAIMLIIGLMAMAGFSYGVSMKLVMPTYTTSATITIPAAEGAPEQTQTEFLDTYRQQLYSDEVMRLAIRQLEQMGDPMFKTASKLRTHVRQHMQVNAAPPNLAMEYVSDQPTLGEPLLTAMTQALFSHRLRTDREAGLPDTTTRIAKSAHTTSSDIMPERYKLAGMILGGLIAATGLLWLIARVAFGRSKRVFDEDDNVQLSTLDKPSTWSPVKVEEA